MEIIATDKRLWVESRFQGHKNTYDLTFFRPAYYGSGLPPTLYIYDERKGILTKRIIGLSEILDYLKERLTEEQFLEVQKFCFENV